VKGTTYAVNEIFCALQGEGAKAGSRNVFIRFAGCNLRCNEKEHGFDCDTEFTSVYKTFTASDLTHEAHQVWGSSKYYKRVILTGGEPALQIDESLIETLQGAGFEVAVETNGTKPLPTGIDWISCSPKTAEHTLVLHHADELRYVRAVRQGVPKPRIKADHYYLSPAANTDGVQKENLKWCLKLVDENPMWSLSTQMHKLWGIR